MPKYSKEMEKEFIARIRSLIVQDPKMTILKVQEILEKHPTKSLHLDRNYIAKLLKKIRNDRANRMNYETVHTILGKFEDEINELKIRLWSILTDPKAKAREKVSAIKELRDGSDTLIGRMFDAGIFERKLGSLKNVVLSPEENAEIERVLGLTGIKGLEAINKYSDEDLSQSSDKEDGDL